MSRITEAANRLGRATYYTGLAQQQMVKMAMDQNPGDPQAAMPQIVAKIAKKLRAELSPQDFQTLMRLLRNEDPSELPDEDWDVHDGGGEIGGRKSGIGMDSARNSLAAMFGDTARVKQDVVSYRPQASGYHNAAPKKRGVTLAMDMDGTDAAAFDSFEAMFGTRKEH